MLNGNVGASLLNIITESLYDKPIVVFREYVQNSVDSFRKAEAKISVEDLYCKIWLEKDCLYFLDNGNGINKENFFNEMNGIGISKKNRSKDIGYKGIGRLSGLPYCSKLIFINICSYKDNIFQKYYIDGEKYNDLKKKPNYNELRFEEMMELIGTYIQEVKGEELFEVQSILNPYKDVFEKQDTGFLVMLENISFVLKSTIELEIGKKEDFYEELGWLLPVKFKGELINSDKKQLFKDLSLPSNELKVIPTKAYNITFNGEIIERPIKEDMLRDYTCKCDFTYAIGFHSFYRDRIAILKENKFSGIKLYLDNMLLCDENELIPILQKYGLIKHTPYELIQTVKGIGAMIYIVDKINISPNARRTFIEITDDDSLEFLRYIAEFINNIYDTRYALSKYNSGKKVLGQSQEKLEQLRTDANFRLQQLAREKITIEFDDDYPKKFSDLDEIEKKKIAKKKLTNYINKKIKEYLLQTSTYDYDNVSDDFIVWLSSNKN
jgi:hypothetical protein